MAATVFFIAVVKSAPESISVRAYSEKRFTVVSLTSSRNASVRTICKRFAILPFHSETSVSGTANTSFQTPTVLLLKLEAFTMDWLNSMNCSNNRGDTLS